ncbi:HAD family phosphatase [Aeromicrobium sp. Leaf350]|uniref:HAD family hydrolase n=1 Tax=Aeromicrobium sp. Leaf350 TaxID=2876565 RepID=UPI001E2DB36C|nr:HAD-IB family hydrolase [Aeromicrobium sp. Leaf350]
MDQTVGGRGAAFFDLDKTIIAKSSTLAFSRPFFAEGLLNRRTVLRSAYAQFMFAVSGADHDQLEKMRAYLTEMVTGWEVATVRQAVAETLHSIIEPLVYDEAVALIAEHRAAGRDIVIVSASGSEVVEPIGALLGADVVVATTLVVEDGRYTGEIDRYAYGPHKAEAMIELADERGYDLTASYAYSDSATDVPMLEAVGHAFAVNPDKALRRASEENGWPVLEFRRPVALTSPLSLDTPTGKILAAAAGVGAVAGAAVAALYVAGRRARTSA